MMQAAVYHGPQDIRVEERPIPTVGSDEVLMRVLSAGICGTDLRILHGGHRMYPAGTIRIPGHEVVGNVVEVGTNVRGVALGQSYFVAPNMGCGHCRQCISGRNNLCADYAAFGITLDGAFAEFMRIPAAAIAQGNLIPIAPSTDPAAAALIEPFACVLRGQNAVTVGIGDVVLIIGAGPIGVMHTYLARLRGAQCVIVSEMMPARLEGARNAGADRVVDSGKEDLFAVVMEESQGQGADVIIVAAMAHQAQQEALRMAAIGGRINYFGGLPKDRPTIEFDSNAVHYKELIVTGTTACSTHDCYQAAALVDAGRIDLSALVTNRFPLDEAQRAFAQAEDRTSLKIVLEP